MHKIAEASPIAFSILILPTTCLAEVRDWGELCVEWSTRIPPVIQVLNSSLCFRFPFEASVHVADQMVTNVVTYLFRDVLAVAKILTIDHTYMKLEKVPKLC